MRWRSHCFTPAGRTHRITGLHRAIAVTVAVGIGAPVGLHAPQVMAAAPADGKDLDEVRRLYEEGKSFFETSQYEKAAELWTRAYGKAPDDSPGVKNAMVYNIATAQEQAYGMDRDIAHLRQAEQLLRRYVENYKVVYAKTPEAKADVDAANARIRDLQEKIKQAESGVAPTPPPAAAAATAPTGARYGSGAVDGIQWNTGSTATVDQEALAENRRLSSESKKTDTMIIAGYIVGSVGLVFLLVGIGGLGGASAVDDVGAARTTRNVGFGTLAIGVAGTAAGATLLGVGFTRRNKIKARQVRLAPMLGPRTAGVSFGMHF